MTPSCHSAWNVAKRNGSAESMCAFAVFHFAVAFIPIIKKTKNPTSNEVGFFIFTTHKF
jgi:hypothetical protein